MRRSTTVAAILLALAAPLAAGGLPARIARLQDYGGHLATHQKETENALVALGLLLAKPPTKELPQQAGLWTDVVLAQGNRFPGLRDNLVAAYKEAHPNRTIRNIGDLPPEYNGAIDKWEAQWGWLAEDGYKAYYRIKWFQLQTKLNKDINTPCGKRAWFWLQQQTGLLESALYGANEEIKRGNLAAFERRIKIAKGYKGAAPVAKEIHKQYKREWDKFFRDTKPEKVGKFVEWFSGWDVKQDTWPALHTMKASMFALITAGLGKYMKSYKDMVKVWTPVIEAKFLTARRQFTKDFKMRSLDRDYRFAIDRLSREMYRRR